VIFSGGRAWLLVGVVACGGRLAEPDAFRAPPNNADRGEDRGGVDAGGGGVTGGATMGGVKSGGTTGGAESGGTTGGAETGPGSYGAAPLGSSIVGGNAHTCAIQAGEVRCWGFNSLGELGGTAPENALATLVDLPGVVSLGTGWDHTCAVLTDGTARCWGQNSDAQLGTGAACRDRPCGESTPQTVAGVRDVRQIAGEIVFTCALVGDGTVLCWGQDEPTPTPVPGMANAVELAVGGGHGCARRADGSVWCWPLSGLSPGAAATRVAQLPPTKGVAAGMAFTCAVLTDGSVSCWGVNDFGEIGDGNIGGDVSVPTPVKNLTGVVQVGAGDRFACARLANGTVQCWGVYDDGQLGDGVINKTSISAGRPYPAPVLDLADAVELAVGRQHACARKASGSIVCWGFNADGQLGDGTTQDRAVPTPVRL
jgi:alpha-tubulin suppressor-like RCC1 family protein